MGDLSYINNEVKKPNTLYKAEQIALLNDIEDYKDEVRFVLVLNCHARPICPGKITCD